MAAKDRKVMPNTSLRRLGDGLPPLPGMGRFMHDHSQGAGGGLSVHGVLERWPQKASLERS